MTVVDTPAPDAPAPDAPAPDPVPAAPPADPPAPPADAPPAADGDPFDDDKIQQFDRGYVEKLRAENAKHRTTAKTYTETFERFDEPSREVLLDLARTLAADPAAGAARMKELAALIEGEPATPDPDADKPLTRAEYDQLQKDRETQETQKALDTQINQEVTDLGYTLGTREHYALLWEAHHNHASDLQAAHKALEAEKQAIRDEYVAEKRLSADGTPTAGSGGSAPAGESPIKTFEDASRSATERAKAAGFRQ